NASFPMKFSLSKASTVQGIPLPFFESINDPKESQAGLLPADITANNACSFSWVPSANDPTKTAGGRPKFSDINKLQLNFDDFVIGAADSGNPLLGSLNFSNCTACFRVQIKLVNANGISQGTLIVYLGSQVPYQVNDGSTSSLVIDPDPNNALRVDA